MERERKRIINLKKPTPYQLIGLEKLRHITEAITEGERRQ
jgi:hypothetical protein